MDADTTHAERLGGRVGTVTLLPSDLPPHNLPDPLTSFIGREREVAELQEALATTRLLTLTGSGGCGKTRLALRTATRILDRFPGGTWWVELGPLGEEELVGAAIAEALGVRPLPGMTPLQAAGAYLASRQSLVILDSCEHLLGGCAKAAAGLLQAGPEVVVLATSRAPLGVGGETDWRVPPLSLPGFRATEPTESLVGSDAVELFAERARKVRPSFAVTDENAELVARICQQLDGLPLAIELAAPRVRMLSVEQIATGVSDRFRLLTGGPRTATPRQQTLRASVDWSHELLSGDEQVLLRRAGAFAGGFTLDAVERVCAGDGIERDRVLDLLASLVDQSLVIAEEGQLGPRYRLLETMRQYALERLAQAGESDTVRARHRDAFLALAERAAPHLETGRQKEWLQVLDPEAANLAAAIEYTLRSEPVLALRLCAALVQWWYARGRFAEAELAQSRSLNACGDREPALRASVLRGRADIAFTTGVTEAAEASATEALALAMEVGDLGTAARARCTLGSIGLYANPRHALAELRRAAELAHEAGDDWALVSANQMLATAYMFQSDHTRSARANEEVAALADRLGDPLQVGRRWAYVGVMAASDGRFSEARDALERARAVVDTVGAPLVEANVDLQLATIDVWEGETERALERLHSRLERSLTFGAGLTVPVLLNAIAWAEVVSGRLEQACDRLEGVVALVDGRDSFLTLWALAILAEARRVLRDDSAESTAVQARAVGERIGNRLFATRARLTLGRLAADRGEWTTASHHVLAHLDVCVEGGHAPYAHACLDALAEVAAGLHRHEDAVRLFAASERAGAELGVVRVTPEEQHWAAIDTQLRDALGDAAYESARIQGAELSTEEIVGWARRARGPRRRPPGGWASLTPTEAKVAELVAQGLTNPQIGERMFISRATVKTHLTHIFGKLDVRSRAELSAQAARRGP